MNQTARILAEKQKNFRMTAVVIIKFVNTVHTIYICSYNALS